MEDWTDLFKKHKKDELGAYIPENKKFIHKDDLSTEANEEEYRKLLAKKFEKLKHKISYLNIEYEEISDIFQHAKRTFISTMFEYCSRKGIEPPFKKEPEQQKQKLKDKKQVKDLYREIVKQTHPDKTVGLSEEEIESRAELYQQATSGKLSGDFNKILKVALDLDIDIQEINPDLLDTIEREIKKMEDKISTMQKDIMYKWFYADPDIQLKIFEQIAG